MPQYSNQPNYGAAEGDRSIRKIPITTGHRSGAGHQLAHQSTPGPHAPRRQKRGVFSILFWALLALVACALAGLALSTVFEEADITLVLKSQAVALPAHMVASEAPSSGLLFTRVLVKSIPEGFIPVQGSLSGGQIAVIDPAQLAQAVAGQTVTSYRGEPVTFSDPAAITASVASGTPTFGHLLIALTTSASSTVLLWHIDHSALQNALSGQDRTTFASTTLALFGSSITEATLHMRPPWKRTLPTNQEKIIITPIQHI